MIRHCRIWLLGALVVALAAGTTVMMAARAQSRGESDSLLSALMTGPSVPSRVTPWQRWRTPPENLDTGAELAARSGVPVPGRPPSAGDR
ncbi:MAG: hypothetical protein WBG92_15625 [Thiohalocapsa sp.]